MNADEDCLDISWINEQERLQSMNQNSYREPMDSIRVNYIYINRNQYIEKILCETETLTKSSNKKFSYIPQEYVLQMIQTKKLRTHDSKYKLIDILLYHIEIEPEHVQSYSNNDSNSESARTCLKTLPISTIKIEPSIFVFHDINSLYFVFQEYPQISYSSLTNSSKKNIKSILKVPKEINSTDIENINKSKTKKVRMLIDSEIEPEFNHDKIMHSKHKITRRITPH